MLLPPSSGCTFPLLSQDLLSYDGGVTVEQRARIFAALGDPTRLAIVEDLLSSDHRPQDLGARYGLPSNLLAHHLGVLEQADLITRTTSSGDRRRRYVSLRHDSLSGLSLNGKDTDRPVLFVCTHNSARSQLAAVLWEEQELGPAASAGTEPAQRIHPGAVAAAGRSGLDLSDRHPRLLTDAAVESARVITVCDQAHEQIEGTIPHWHWSTPDPVADPTDQSFDNTLALLRRRIATITKATG